MPGTLSRIRDLQLYSLNSKCKFLKRLHKQKTAFSRNLELSRKLKKSWSSPHKKP